MQSTRFSFPRIFGWFIKIAIVLAVALYIYWKIVLRSDIGSFPERFDTALATHPLCILLAFFLLFVNWGLEALKWQTLVQPVSPIGYLRAVRAVLAGVATGVFTPNRAGEFGGRVLDMEKGHRLEAALLSFAGGLTQLAVTICVALPALFFSPYAGMEVLPHLTLTFLFLALCVLLISVGWILRRKASPALRKWIAVFEGQPLRHWLHIALLSLLRYGVFSMQFYLLLWALGIQLSVAQALAAIPLTFFATTVIPTFALSEIGIRGSVSVVFIGFFSPDSLGILIASFALWIINIALPALVGSVIVLQMDLFKKATKPC